MNNLFVRKIKINQENIENYDVYPFNIPLIANFKALELNKPVTFIVGENGSGKSTLIESIAVALGLNPEGGSQNFNFSTFDSHSELHKHIKIEKGIKRPSTRYFLRAESFYNVATETDKIPDALDAIGGTSLHKRSHGESFIQLIENRFYNNGLYLLDEPEAALSPTRQMQFLALVDDLVKHGSQFIICTHSPIILSYPNAEIYQINENKLELTEYKNTELYNIYKSFLQNPERTLNILLDE